jgi:hypothetical protein
MSVLILDLDGTLANLDHRSHLVEQDEPDWDAFFAPELIAEDKPIPEAQEALSSVDEFDDLIFLTGRPEKARQVTEDWLDEYFGFQPDDYVLFMRADDDVRPSVEYKEEVIVDLLEGLPETDVILVDDEEDNLAMMTEYGEALNPEEAWEVLT